jgi:hypothetical protein
MPVVVLNRPTGVGKNLTSVAAFNARTGGDELAPAVAINVQTGSRKFCANRSMKQHKERLVENKSENRGLETGSANNLLKSNIFSLFSGSQ